jgi:imidazolonepropionase-like amidohydrolase
MTKQTQTRPVVISGAQLIDGRGSAPIGQGGVVLRDGKIDQVFEGPVPPSIAEMAAEVFDVPGCTILPGLIDCHAHLDLPGDGTAFADSVKESDGVFVANAAFGAQAALDAGVTTLRDTGARGTTTFDLRRALELGYGRGPKLVLCGEPITITGGHIWYFGGEADGPDALRRKVRAMAKAGADFIKVVGTGGGTPNTISWLPAFSREELEVLVDESHRQNRRVTVHCLCATAITMAVEAGVDQIEHASFIVDDSARQEYDPKVAAQLAESGIPVTSTLSVAGYGVSTLTAKEDRSSSETATLERWKRMREANLEQAGMLRDAGVNFVAGTDGGWSYTPFDALPEEIALLSESGMSASDAIVSATGRAAAVLGIEGKVGSLAGGLAADLLVVHGDPLRDLAALRDVRLVVQDGVVVRDGAPGSKR